MQEHFQNLACGISRLHFVNPNTIGIHICDAKNYAMAKKSQKPYEMLPLFDHYLKEMRSGRRLMSGGKKINPGTLRNIGYTRSLLADFSCQRQFPLRILPVAGLGKREMQKEKRYWSDFYNQFTGFLYEEKQCFDNYTGKTVKNLRGFLHYLQTERGIDPGNFFRKFHVLSEEIQILTLLPEQLNFLIYDEGFEGRLSTSMRRTRDLFVFGCTVALRVSDLLALQRENLEYANGEHYLCVHSKKTRTYTRIKLPEYAVDIIRRNVHGRRKTIFRRISLTNLNKNIKRLIRLAGWDHPVIKTRTRRGTPVALYRKASSREHYRFCDLVSSHTMRRTAITTMLCLRMPENLVRRISGHASNSKEFYRYVQLSQTFIDQESDRIFEKLRERKWHKNAS